MVGEGDGIGGHRRGDGERRLARHRLEPVLTEISGERVLEGGVVVAGEHARTADEPVTVDQSEACVGGTDVANEPARLSIHGCHAQCAAAASASACTKFSRQAPMLLRRRMAIMDCQRSMRSPSGMARASCMASAMPSMSIGLTSNASLSSRAAPAKEDSTSTPGSSGSCAATYSLATRFMPSRHGVTSPTRLERYMPASAERDTDLTTKRIGTQSISEYL